MSAMSELDHEITSSIQRGWQQALELCEQLAAGYHAAGDIPNSQYYDQAVLRYRQAIDGARDAWAHADRLVVLRATVAMDPETEACSARDTEEMPRVN